MAKPETLDPGFRTVGLVARADLRDAALLAELTAWLETRGLRVLLDDETAALAGAPAGRLALPKHELARQVDLAVVLGGDGTLLSMADRIAEAGVDTPIVGVNFGSLGFLTEITLEELYPALQSTLDGTARVDRRLMLRSRVWRGEAVLADRIVLNDVVVSRGSGVSIIDLSVSAGDEFVTRVRADGVIVASPTGSTAYNLACGGPIVHPEVDALVLTPIAPHTLTNRPVVIPATAEVRIQPTFDRDDVEAVASFDGQFATRLESGDAVTVCPAPKPLRLVRSTARTYFEVLRQKLKWGER